MEQTMSVTRRIVNYIINLDFRKIPDEVVRRTREFDLDEIGNTLGGAALQSGNIIIKWRKQIGGILVKTYSKMNILWNYADVPGPGAYLEYGGECF
jgi:hypothetical protein